MTVQDEEGNYNVYLDSRLTYEAHIETLQHEIQHIASNEINQHWHIKDIENKIHKRKVD